MCEQDNNYHQVNMSSPIQLTEAQKADLPEILAQGKPVQPKITCSAKIVEILDLVKPHHSDEDFIDLINKLQNYYKNYE